MKLLQHIEAQIQPEPRVIALPNDADLLALAQELQNVQRVDLHFPKFSDGRAFSQAWLLRRRLGFAGEIRATGDVLIDQLLPMKRCGFSEAVLRGDQDAAHGARLLAGFDGFYQGDIEKAQPRFSRQAA